MKFFLALKKKWMTFARAIGWFNTRLMLIIIYFIVLAIPALLLKIIRKDLLDRKFSARSTYWIEKEKIIHTIEQAKRQF